MKWQAEKLRQSNNVQHIDEASTRDALYAMYYQLTHIMGKGTGDTIWCEGEFQVTSDEAFQLRDRVLRRVGGFGLSAAALEEVQSKKGLVDW